MTQGEYYYALITINRYQSIFLRYDVNSVTTCIVHLALGIRSKMLSGCVWSWSYTPGFGLAVENSVLVLVIGYAHHSVLYLRNLLNLIFRIKISTFSVLYITLMDYDIVL